MRRIAISTISLLIALTLSLISPSSAQGRWSMWVYQPDSGQLWRVDDSGQVIARQMLSAQPATETLVMSSTGNRLAYLHADYQHITVIDLDSGHELLMLGLSEIGIAHNADDELWLDPLAFSADGAMLVYGEKLAGFGWQWHVHDIDSNQRRQTLAYGDALTRNYPPLHGGVRPRLTQFIDGRLTITIDVDFPARVHSYHWFYRAGILSETVAAPTLTTAALPDNGSVISARPDSRFSATNENFRYRWQQVNTIHAYNGTQGRFPIFYEPSLSFETLLSVQGGERVLARAYVNPVVDVWLLIDRDGTEIRRYPIAGTDTTGTPDGYIYATPVEDQTAVVTVDTRNSTSGGTTLWVQAGDWHIIWAGILQPQRPFAPWIPLAPPLADPSGIVSRQATPTTAPSVPPFRAVNMPIQIFVPDEGFLNLRDAPSTSGAVIAVLESGTRGVITDGAVTADGYTWWQISVGGRLGWVVESLPDSLALIPPQIIPSATPTPTTTPNP